MNETTLRTLNHWKENGDVHASNIVGKDSENYSGIKGQSLQKHMSKYMEYRYKLKNSKNILERTKALNEFKTFAFDNNRDSLKKQIFSAQSKFIPTIMEEFLKLLIEPIADQYNYNCRSSHAYSQMSIQSIPGGQPIVEISAKDQDIAVYESITLTINEKVQKVDIPILSIECKTYLDKTMLEGAASTATRLKQGVTNTKFLVVTETYAVSSKVKKPRDIDKIFVTKKTMHTKEDHTVSHCHKVIQMIYNYVNDHIGTSTKSTKEIIEDGLSKGVIE